MMTKEAAPLVEAPPNPPAVEPLANPPCWPEHLIHKNRLQQYAQRSAKALPIYITVNEGSSHAPKFRSTVTLGGVSYRSFNTFLHRKEAEQDVAKFAFEYISKNPKDERCPLGPLDYEDTIFCKSILYEFAVKMNLAMPTYKTTKQSEGLLPVFISSLEFEGKTYTGAAGRNKKEAEQLAARTVIRSILGSGSGMCIFEIIKSKSKLYDALHRVEEPKPVQETNMPIVISPENNCESSTRKRKEIPSTSSSQQFVENVTIPPPLYAYKKPKEEVLYGTSARPIGIVAPLLDQPVGGCPGRLASEECKSVSDVHLTHQKQKEEVVYDTSARPIGIVAPAPLLDQPVGGCPDRLASEEYKSVSDVHLAHQNQLINGSLVVQPSLMSHGSEITAIDISVGRKYPRGKNKKKRQKKIQNGEQIQMTPVLTTNQAPSCSVTL